MIFIGTVATAIHPLYYASGPFLCDVRNIFIHGLDQSLPLSLLLKFYRGE